VRRGGVTPWEPDSGITLLGCPISFPGTSSQTVHRWDAVLADLEKATDRVTQVADLQVAHHLLRACLDACKVNHLLRCSDPYVVEDRVVKADQLIRKAFEHLLGAGMSPTQAEQAALPIGVGGCVPHRGEAGCTSLISPPLLLWRSASRGCSGSAL